jgi:hypothetical protein
MEKKILSRHEYNLKMANQYVSVIDRQLYALDNGGAEGITLVWTPTARSMRVLLKRSIRSLHPS